MKIDFRSEYQVVSVVSFAITFSIFLALLSTLDSLSGIPGFLGKFFVSLGFYLFIFRSLIFLYNKWLWKYLGHRDIAISGYWRYTIYKATSKLSVQGYAYIIQDMYDITIYGFNIGSGGDRTSIGFWRAENIFISSHTLFYDYEVLGERPNRVSRITRGRTTVNLFGKPPQQMVGTYMDFLIATSGATTNTNLVGSICYEKCSLEDLSEGVLNIFKSISTVNTLPPMPNQQEVQERAVVPQSHGDRREFQQALDKMPDGEPRTDNRLL
jgi:hypothetical protein